MYDTYLDEGEQELSVESLRHRRGSPHVHQQLVQDLQARFRCRGGGEDKDR